MDVNLTDLDLNQEPMDPQPPPATSFESQSMLLLDRAQELVEERIRRLEGVSARERQRRDRAQTITIVGTNNNSTAETTKGCKRDSSHLVAKALEIDPGTKKPDTETGNFYDCNICFDLAIEPILTCCGHLFCWACFYQVANVDLNSKECPVCKGEVSEKAITPIYGDSSNERVDETESGLIIPPRPQAQRVESIRQQIAVHGVPNVHVEDALRRIMVSIDEGAYSYETEPRPSGGSRLRVHQVTRVLSESAASLSSLSSALNSAERLVEELETVISTRMAAPNPPGRGSTLLEFVEQQEAERVAQQEAQREAERAAQQEAQREAEREAQESTLDFSAALRVDRSGRSTDVSGSDARFLARRTSRRSAMARNNSDADGRETRESRRRRLN